MTSSHLGLSNQLTVAGQIHRRRSRPATLTTLVHQHLGTGPKTLPVVRPADLERRRRAGAGHSGPTTSDRGGRQWVGDGIAERRKQHR